MHYTVHNLENNSKVNHNKVCALSYLYLQLTYADFAVHLIVDYIIQTGCFPNMMEGFPKLLKLRDDVANIPSIKKWIEQRPECNYYKIKD